MRGRLAVKVRWGRFVAMVALCVVALAPSGWATVKSQARYARGLVPFNEGNWAEAYVLFNRAVEADRTDAVALYYRGLTQARQGNTTGAIQDIEQALVYNAALPHASLDLGIAYFSAGRHEDAKRALERAYQQGHERLVAAFFLGLTEYRLGDEKSALRYLDEAGSDPELAGAASYYEGLIDIKDGTPGLARKKFEITASHLPESEIGHAAQRYLATGGLTPATAGSGKPWSIYGGVNFEYDSNVTIGPGDSDFITPVDVTEQADGRFVLQAGGRYTFLDRDSIRLSGSYDLSQSIHFDLSEYDLQGHRLGIQVASGAGRWHYGLAGGYDFFLLDFQSFFHEGYGTPWVSLEEGEHAATQAFYTIRGRDFLRRPYDPGRDAVNHAFGLRQYFSLFEPDQVLAIGYRYEIEDTVSNGPQGRAFAYHAQLLDASFQMRVFENTDLQFAYTLSLVKYDNANSGFSPTGLKKRDDTENQIMAGIRQPLTDRLAATLYYIGVFHGSNVTEFDYNRQIISAGLRYSY